MFSRFSCVWLFVTPWTVAHLVPLSLGSPQERILEWVAMTSSWGFSQPWDRLRSPTLWTDSLLTEPPPKPKNTGVGSLSLFQGNRPDPGIEPQSLHCRQILYLLRYQGSTAMHHILFNTLTTQEEDWKRRNIISSKLFHEREEEQEETDEKEKT